MRINITLDVAPEELPLATELLAVLRQLTDHVSVNGVSAAAPPGSLPAAPAQAAPPPLPAMPGAAPSAADHAANGVQPASAGAAPPHAIAPAPAPPTPANSGQAATAAVAASVPQTIVFPPGTPPQQQLHALIAQSEYSDNLEALALQLEATINDPALGGREVLFPEFCAIWSQLALDPALAAMERSAVPFVLLLQKTSLEFRHKFRDHIMRVLLKHLTTQRPPNAERGEFYVHAEAFAALVSIEIVPIDGAVQTMCALAKHPQKRCAGITMMGKSVELAGHLIAEKVPESTLSTMRSIVQSLAGDENFQYDVDYISATMGWEAAPQPSAGGGAGGARQLRPVHSIPGAHNEMIFALAVDAAHQQFVTGGKDTYLQVWTQDGRPVQKLDLGDQYISSMDFHPRINMLLCSSVNQGTNTLRLAGYISGQPNGFGLQGFVGRDDMVAVATVRALPETNGFLTGETAAVGPNRSTAPIIRFWDMAAAPSFQALQPTQSFTGHTSIATALRGLAGDANLFVSGDKDGAMLLWDLRAPQHVGAFGSPDATGRTKAHAMMITSIESAGPLIVSGSTDKSVSLWDARHFGAPVGRAAADNMTVLKLALNASLSTVVVSAVNSMRLLDITRPEAPVLSEPVAASWPDGRPRSTYHDVKWNEGLGMLYAVGKDKLVDLYSLG